jgi:hypothetical protein
MQTPHLAIPLADHSNSSGDPDGGAHDDTDAEAWIANEGFEEGGAGAPLGLAETQARVRPLLPATRQLNGRVAKIGTTPARGSEAYRRKPLAPWAGLRAEFAEILSATDRKTFEEALQTAEPDAMNADEATAFREGVDFDGVATGLVHAVARDNSQGAELKRLRESVAWRRVVVGAARFDFDDEAAEAEGHHDQATGAVEPDRFANFAPLLRWIAAEASPSLKTELTSRMELYVHSKHAQRDCVDPIDPLRQPTQAALAMRALHAALAEPHAEGDGAPLLTPAKAAADSRARAAAMQTISRRFDELFEKVHVDRRQDARGEQDWIARAEPRSPKGAGASTRSSFGRAGSGEIDAFIRDADNPEIVRIAVATGDITTGREGNQAFRHLQAVLNAIKEGALPGVKQVIAYYHVPGLVYSAPAPDGKEIQGRILANLTEAPTSEGREAINLLPFLSQTARIDRGNEHLDVSALAHIQLCLIGASADRWNARTRDVTQLPKAQQNEAFLRLTTHTMATAIDALAKLDPTQPLLKSSGVNQAVFACLCEGLEGASRHAMDCPDVMAPIEERKGKLALIRHTLTKDSEIRGRLDDFSQKLYGGFAAWVATARAREQEEQAELAAIRALGAAPEPAVRELASPTSIAPRVEASAPGSGVLTLQERIERIAIAEEAFDAICQIVEEAAGGREILPRAEIDATRKRIYAVLSANGGAPLPAERALVDELLRPNGGGVQMILAARDDRLLVQACGASDTVTAMVLLERGASPFAEHKGVSAFDAAERSGNADLVRVIDRAQWAEQVARAENEAIAELERMARRGERLGREEGSHIPSEGALAANGDAAEPGVSARDAAHRARLEASKTAPAQGVGSTVSKAKAARKAKLQSLYAAIEMEAAAAAEESSAPRIEPPRSSEPAAQNDAGFPARVSTPDSLTPSSKRSLRPGA